MTYNFSTQTSLALKITEFVFASIKKISFFLKKAALLINLSTVTHVGTNKGGEIDGYVCAVDMLSFKFSVPYWFGLNFSD